MNYREKMKEYLKEPDEYSSDWGRWGILNKEQRTLIRRVLDEMDSADEVIKHQFEEIETLTNIIKSARDLFYEKCRISQNGVYTFNQVDYEELDNVLKGVDKE